MSDASSTSSSGSGGSEKSLSQASPRKLAQRIQRKLAAPLIETLAVASHKAASETMAELHTQLIDGAILDQSGKMCLTCAGIGVCKRIATDLEMPDANDQLRTTLALLYVLIVMASGPVDPPTGASSSDDPMELEEPKEDLIEIWSNHSVADVLYATATSATTSWTDELKDPAALCRACLANAFKNGSQMSMDDISVAGANFFRASAQAMATSLFNCCSPQGDDFLTLGSASFLCKANDNKSEKLTAIVDVAESEAGQSVLRDIILSFTLPRKVLGVRRVALLTRDANAKATADYTEILNSAHEAAMRAANYCWAEDTNEIHQMSALLAGIAVLLAKGQQSIRKDDAFSGRVDLPFLETRPPPAGVPRMALLEATAEWIVYSTNPKTGKPDVQLRAEGFEGLCQAAILFVSHLQL